MKVRPADFGDVSDIVRLLMDHFYTEHDVGVKLPLSPERVFEHVMSHIGGGQVFVADNGEIVGVLMLKPFYPWWTTSPVLSDGGFYVRKDCRSAKLFSAFMDCAESFASTQKLPLIIDLFNKEDVDRKDVLFRRRGFIRVGGTYLKASHVLQ